MTLIKEDTGSDAIRNFQKRKYEDHNKSGFKKKKFDQGRQNFPEGFGGGNSAFDDSQNKFSDGPGNRFSKGPGNKFSKGPGNKFSKGPPHKFSKGPPNKFSHFQQNTNFGSGDGSQPNEKPDWNKLKQENKEKKVIRQQRKLESGIYDLGVQSKKIWEELRESNCKKQRREELCDKLLSLVKGKVKNIIFAHDTVRVMETIMIHGLPKQRTVLFEETKDSLVELSKNKYAKHFVLKILVYGTKEEKNKVMEALKGKVTKLMNHKMASDVVELAYNDYANAAQRATMAQEFYGPEFRLFHDPSITCLEDAFKKHPEKKVLILKDMKKYLQPVLEKGVFTNTMVHTLLRDFLTHCSDEERAPIIEALREGLMPILHTKDGARVAMLCLWHGTNKDRKLILKSFKTFYTKIALEPHGYMVLLAAFDCMDDTEFMRKAVLNELMEELPPLIASEPGMKVLRYLIAPRNPLFFNSQIIKILEQGDGNKSSKKDTEVRRQELLKPIRAPILRVLLANLEHWYTNTNWTLFIATAVNALAIFETKSIFEQLAKFFAKEYTPDCEGHFLELNHTVKMAQLIIKGDKKRDEEGKPTFSGILLTEAETVVPSWINCNRGCFLLVNLIESEVEDIVLKMKRFLKPVKDTLPTLKTKGADILFEKL